MQKCLFLLLNNDKQFDRQIKALMHLSLVRTSVSIQELAMTVGCSEPTLRHDISVLNKALPHNIKVSSFDKDGYVFHHPEGTSISEIMMNIAKESDIYKIIDSIFHHEVQSFDELLAELFISPSTLRRTLAHINQVLNQYNVSLSTSKIDIIGDESDIRYFFFKFYSDFSTFFAVDKEYENNEITYQILHNEILNLHIPNLYLSNFRTSLWIMVVRKRIKHRHFVTVDADLVKSILALPAFHEFQSSIVRISAKYFQIKDLPLNEIIWFFIVSLHCISYSSPSQQSGDPTHSYIFHYETSQDITNRVNRFLSKQFDQRTIQSSDLEPMRSFLINLSTLTRLSPQFQRVSSSFHAFTKEANRDYYTLWYNHLTNLQEGELYPIYFIEDVAVVLSMLHFSIVRHKRKYDLRVVFAFHGEPGYDDFLMRTAQHMIPQSIQPTFLFDKPVSLDIVKQTNADLVVSNYDLPNALTLPCKVVRLSYIPTVSEWTTLRNIIQNMSSDAQYQHTDYGHTLT